MRFYNTATILFLSVLFLSLISEEASLLNQPFSQRQMHDNQEYSYLDIDNDYDESDDLVTDDAHLDLEHQMQTFFQNAANSLRKAGNISNGGNGNVSMSVPVNQLRYAKYDDKEEEKVRLSKASKSDGNDSDNDGNVNEEILRKLNEINVDIYEKIGSHSIKILVSFICLLFLGTYYYYNSNNSKTNTNYNNKYTITPAYRSSTCNSTRPSTTINFFNML